MVRDELSVLSVFLAVAEERSFTRAAKRFDASAPLNMQVSLGNLVLHLSEHYW